MALALGREGLEELLGAGRREAVRVQSAQRALVGKRGGGARGFPLRVGRAAEVLVGAEFVGVGWSEGGGVAVVGQEGAALVFAPGDFLGGGKVDLVPCG
ncbi:MAG: hypothetical protein AAFO91_11560 [Bacteroidota bacterium]